MNTDRSPNTDQFGPHDPVTLPEVADLYPLAYSTLAQAVREGRLQARQAGKIWITTRAAVEEAIAEGRLRPRRKAED